MYKKAWFIVLFLSGSVILQSCRETVREETTVREVEVESDDDDEGIFERSAKEVDKEINEEIEKIGDDN